MDMTRDSRFVRLREMSTQQLREILRQDFELPEEESDFELVSEVMEELERRFQKSKAPVFAGEAEALERMRRETEALAAEEAAEPAREKPSRRRGWMRIAAAAAVLALVVLPGTGSLFGWFGSAAKEPAFNYDAAFGGVEAVLHSYGMEEAGLPQWLPDAYECTDIKIRESSDGTTVSAREEAGEQSMVLTVEQLPAPEEAPESAPKPVPQASESTSTRIYEREGTRYYISQQDGGLIISWTREGLRVSMEFTDGELDAEKVIGSQGDWRGSAGASSQSGLADQLTPARFSGTQRNW